MAAASAAVAAALAAAVVRAAAARVAVARAAAAWAVARSSCGKGRGREARVQGSWEPFKVLLQDRSAMSPIQTGFPRGCSHAGGAQCPHMAITRH